MAAPSTESSSPTFLQRHLGLTLDEYLALPPRERSERAAAVAADVSFFLDEGRPFDQRDVPARTRELAEGLHTELRAARRLDAARERSLARRIVTDELLRTECDHDQNVYLGPPFTRWLTNAVPDLVFQPVDASEVATALRCARRAGVPVTLRGAASTAMGGAVPADGGVVLDLSRLDRIEVDRAAGRVRVGAGTRMRPLHAQLADAGLALPVYPSNLGGTFAGWLSTGGIGLNAFGRGRALDSVHSADVVLPGGERVRLRADGTVDVNGEAQRRTLEGEAARAWFEKRGYPPLRLADLAGSEGQLGVVVALELAVEARPELAVFLLAFERESDAFRAVEWIAARRDGEPPADLKLLTASHLHHARRVWAEEDAKPWRAQPSALSDDRRLPWTRVLSPAELGVATAESERAQAYVYVDFLTREGGRAFAGALAECPGAPRVSDADSVRFARDRFRPQQAKRLGPALIAAEILLPADRVEGFVPAARRLAHRGGTEADVEVYYLADGTALALAGFLADHRRASFAAEIALAPALLDLAMSRFGGRPYVLGRWQANLFRRKFGRAESQRLRQLKRGLDPGRVVNRGSFFQMGLRGPAGKALELALGPLVRAMRLVIGTTPALGRGLRAVLGRFPGPAAGRGVGSDELPAAPEPAGDPAAATGRAIACVNCGECNSVCPIFDDAGIRLPQVLTHQGEELHATGALAASGPTLLDLCMRCGNCEEVCQAGIPHLALYGAMQTVADGARPHDRERHVLLLEALRGSRGYTDGFLRVRPGGYEKRTPAALTGSARFLLLRAEGEAGPAATCIHCAACVDVCPTEANREFEGADPRWITTVQERCIGCGTCVEVCPANLLNGGRTLRVMEAPALDWFAASREFEAREAAAVADGGRA